MNWATRLRDQWIYRITGPTTLHMQHEFYLLVSLSLLTVSSLQALYKGSFGLRGDHQFIFLATLWLSRHLILRWLCTWDTSTSRCPTIFGVLSHWITSHVMAGQYFDRPNPQVIAKQIGTHHEDGRGGASLNSFFLPSIIYTWQMIKVWIWYPLVHIQEVILVAFDQNNKRKVGDTAGRGAQSLPALRRERSSPPNANPYVTKAYSYWNKFWTAYGPPLQMIIPVATMTFYLWYLFFAPSAPTQTSHALTMNPRNAQVDELNSFDTKPYGAYQKMDKPQWHQVLFFLSCAGTLSSIFFYGRIFLPIADLVAGSNVLKAVRNEAKLYGNQGSGGVSTGSEPSLILR
jgi:hypothetical protein